MGRRLRSVTSWQTSRSERGATVIGERRTWSPCRGRRRWARKVAAEASAGRASSTRARGDARTIGLACPARTRMGQAGERTGRSVRSARGSRVRRQAALRRQVADRLPGELRGLGMRVLPPVDGRDGDRDLVRELLLRHAELLAESADQAARGLRHGGSTEQPTCHEQRRPPARFDAALAPARRQKASACGEIAPRPCARRWHLAMAGAMIYVHEVHEILGGKMAEFGEAVRAEWRPLVEEGDGARLLWFWQLAHGTGASYQAVSITAVRDWATWGALVARGASDPRFRAWQRRVWTLRREVTAKILLPVPWSPLREADLAAAPSADQTETPALYLHDTGWPFAGKLEDYVEALGTIFYLKTRRGRLISVPACLTVSP